MSRLHEDTSSPAVAWQAHYSVGNNLLDQQHREILSLVNWCFEAMSSERELDGVPGIVRRLAEYTSLHFRDEERIMRQCDFPGFEEHTQTHIRLAEKTLDLQFECLQEVPPKARDIVQFLKQWWVNHITGDDQQYARYLQPSDQEEEEPVAVSQEEEEPVAVSEVCELLDLLTANENQLGRYYMTMAGLVPEHESTWRLLRQQEAEHAGALRRVRRAVDKDPDLFAPGDYSASAVRTMTREIGQMIDQIQRGEVQPGYAVTFITDIEQSLLESRLEEAVKTDVVEIGNVLARLTEETAEHRDLLKSISL